MIGSNNQNISIKRQCHLLDISRSRCYYSPRKEKLENLKIMKVLDQHFLKHPIMEVEE